MGRFLTVGMVLLVVSFATFPNGAVVAQGDGPEATIAALQTQVADLGGAEPTETPQRRSTPEPRSEVPQEVDAEQGLVNVEMILDVSGSMAQVLDTGETRMDAAKSVLNAVIAAIPERDGVNVGLRIYGHEGNNTEAGQAQSCESSDLVVPVEGVEKGDLADEIDALQPTGWTPIGISLERAEEDFPDAGEGVTNAVVLVTDGLETCGGDPVETAAAILDGEKEIVTNVIGFALTGEEQQLLAGIAEAGDGQLLGAQNAAELNSALFTVLEDLEIVAGTGYVGGNAFSLIPAGESGEVSVVATGEVDQFGQIPFVVRNNTTEDVASVQVSVTARDASGALVGVANASQVRPSFVPVGGIGFGVASFGNVSLPAEASFEFEAEAEAASDQSLRLFPRSQCCRCLLVRRPDCGRGRERTRPARRRSHLCGDLLRSRWQPSQPQPRQRQHHSGAWRNGGVSNHDPLVRHFRGRLSGVSRHRNGFLVTADPKPIADHAKSRPSDARAGERSGYVAPSLPTSRRATRTVSSLT